MNQWRGHKVKFDREMAHIVWKEIRKKTGRKFTSFLKNLLETT